MYLKQYHKLEGHFMLLSALLLTTMLFAQQGSNQGGERFPILIMKILLNVNGNENRFPLILSDAKSLFSEAIIADHHGDFSGSALCSR